MSTTTVKRDVHGLYARGAGYVWRPVYPAVYLYMPTTRYSEGNRVSVSHTGGPMASIIRNGSKERWYSHGMYIKLNEKGYVPSEDLFKPSYERW